MGGKRHTRKGSKAMVKNSKGQLLSKEQGAEKDARASKAETFLARTHLEVPE